MSKILDKYMEEAAKEMSREVDREVLWGMLKEIGWTRVNLPSHFRDNEHAVDVRDWIKNNIKNAYEQAGADFIFENDKDASLFILKWA